MWLNPFVPRPATGNPVSVAFDEPAPSDRFDPIGRMGNQEAAADFTPNGRLDYHALVDPLYGDCRREINVISL